LRLLEALRLRVKDIDFAINQITVRDGKGQKDRLTMLPAAAKSLLMEHLKEARQIHQQDLHQGLDGCTCRTLWPGNTPTLSESGIGSTYFLLRTFQLIRVWVLGDVTTWMNPSSSAPSRRLSAMRV
jgi:integrase